ncbi:MAG TPA: asparagine synthase (glutamine-hydrolyzing) [Salinivirgaceae bacterium]|nr:asparagine synthase (glutamine-hydrolyzing) [Salinivirgaceae bacterium]
MCAINGIYSFPSAYNSEYLNKKIVVMNATVSHRGSDGEGVYVDAESSYSVGLGHRKLATSAPKGNNQPMFSTDKRQVIICDGKIYNFKELKNTYLANDENLTSKTDAEIILKLYKKHGVSAFSKLEGMFAFSIYDKEKKKLFLVRDFFGLKPLYYTSVNGVFYWASELKSILAILPHKPEIDFTGLNLFFRLSYIPAPYTIYSGICKLEGNHYIELDCLSGEFSVNPIVVGMKQETVSGFEEAVKKTRELVNRSVISRLAADVPIGAFLSGGVDSSIISLCASRQLSTPLKTFSIGFDKKSFDETDKSQTVAKLIGSHHHEFVVKEKNMLDVIDRILLNFDEPFADSSALPSYMVAYHTSEHCKVALTGDGGDEVFGGYNKYYMGKLNRTYTRWMPQSLHKWILAGSKSLINMKDDSRGFKFKINRLLKGIDYNSDYYFNIISLGFMEDEAEELLIGDAYVHNPMLIYKQKNIEKRNTIHGFREIDRLLSLEGDMNVKVDRTAMLASIETRSPFLNKELWEFSSQLPENYLIKGINKKYILKKAFEKDFPKGFLDKSKKGFGVPVGDWLRGSLRDKIESYTEKDFLKKQGIFNIEYITTLVENHISGKIDNTFRVWPFYCFQKWYETNMPTF